MHAPAPLPALADRLAQALRDHAPLTRDTEPHLRAVLEQAVGHPGRLLRAQLVHTGARRHGMDEAAAARLAVAIEYFHLASLVLDDLPCMDNATERRGRLCPHLVHGEATVILAALALINRGYALIGFAMAGFAPEWRLPAQACLDACLGAAGLVGGQAADLRFGEARATPRLVGRIALRKTGALFSVAVVLPGFLAAPSLAEFRALKALCVYWGLAYQIADDLSDAAGAQDRARPNLAAVIGVGAARARLARLLRLADGTLRRLTRAHPRWDYLAEFQARLLPAGETRHPGLAA